MRRRANGEGTIFLRKDGRWEAAILVDGRRRRHCARTQAAARRWLTEAHKARDDGIPLPSRRLTLNAYLPDWLERRRSQIRPSTWARYHQFIRLHLLPQVGTIRLADLTPQDVERFQEKMLASGASPTSVHHAHSTLHRALKDAVRSGLASRNVAALVSPPRVASTEMKVLSEDQVRTFIAEVRGDPLEALWMLAVTTGIRQGELLGLRWSAIDWQRNRLSVLKALVMTNDGYGLADPKTSRSRRPVAFPAAVGDFLQRHKKGQARERLRAGSEWHDYDLVFCREDGRPLRAFHLHWRFKRLLTKAGLPEIRFHDLRHTAEP